MNLKEVTPVILTYNEVQNIERTLERLSWAHEIVVVDSYSKDETLDILKKYPQVKVHERTFDTMANQWNFGLSQVQTDWVLSLDADYYVTEELRRELEELGDDVNDGYSIPFRYCVFGKPLIGSLLPPRVALFRKSCSRYIDDGHTQLLECDGSIGQLRQPLLHDDRKPLNRWLDNQKNYISLEADKLLHEEITQLPLADRIRRTKWLAPFLVFFYALFVKGAILSGWRGVFYAYQRMFVESLLAIRLIELEHDTMLQKPHRCPNYLK